MMGLSTFIAGTTHAFRGYMNNSLYMFLWLATQVLICISVYFASRGTIESEYKNSMFYKGIVLVQLITFSALVIIIKDFKIASIATAFGLIPIMIIYYANHLKDNPSKKLIALGVFVSFLTAIVFQLKLSIDKWFNYKDLSHIIIMVSLWLMYKGVKGLYKDEELRAA
jgi:hypothetical protein